MPPFPADKQEILRLMAELRSKLESHNKAYYQDATPVISDALYDQMMTRLEELESQYPELISADSPTQTVGSDLPSGADAIKIEHTLPMLSIDKLSTWVRVNTKSGADKPDSDKKNGGAEDKKELLKNWYNFVTRQSEHKNSLFVCELKIDGMSVALRYEQGKLITALTRGNGLMGEDITEQVKKIPAVPKKLTRPLTLEVRGEIYFPLSDFEAYNNARKNVGAEVYKNPRNTVAGVVRAKNTDEEALRMMKIFLYDWADGDMDDSHAVNLRLLKELGLPVISVFKQTDSVEEIAEFCNRWEAERKHLDFDADGVVIKADSLEKRRELGARERSPRWAVAWKFDPKQAETRVLGIENSVGRTGIVTPIALLEPVELSETTVKRATLHNYKQIKDLDIRLGDTVFIMKGGEIIPKVLAVNLLKREAGSQPLSPPELCPKCSYVLNNTNLHELRCENPDCPARIVGKLKYFVSRDALDIRHLGEAQIELLLERGLIGDCYDIFELHHHRSVIAEWEGYGEKSVSRLFESIEEARRQSLHRFIVAFGIPNIGEKAAKVLASEIGSLAALLTTEKSHLQKLPDFGDITAESVLTWINGETNRLLVQKFIDAGINPVWDDSTVKLKNQTVVITGKLSKARGEWKNMLESCGYTVSNAVSAKTTYLLAGEDAGSKLDEARRLNIRILSEAEMLKLLDQDERN